MAPHTLRLAICSTPIRDYTAECDLLENIFHRYGDKPIPRVLDLSCGTGSHTFPLVSRSYEVVGIERSESMLAQAYTHARIRKAPTLPLKSYVYMAPPFVYLNGQSAGLTYLLTFSARVCGCVADHLKMATREDTLRRLTPLPALQQDILRRLGLGMSRYRQLEIQEIGN